MKVRFVSPSSDYVRVPTTYAAEDEKFDVLHKNGPDDTWMALPRSLESDMFVFVLSALLIKCFMISFKASDKNLILPRDIHYHILVTTES